MPPAVQQLIGELTVHLPVVSGRSTDDGFQIARPYVYGTAFPILPGVLATAAHVVNAAAADGEVGVALYGAAGLQVNGRPVHGYDLADALDLALLYVPSLERLPGLPMSFSELGLRHVVSATGFPFAVDAEWVNILPRSFQGHVITRRELLHLAPSQPPGYELSFPTPPGMSGAPLLAQRDDGWTCNGWIIQQIRLGGEGENGMLVGLAVCASTMLSLTSGRLGPLAHRFRREVRPIRPPTKAQRPGGIDRLEITEAGWPDEDGAG